MDPNLTKIMAVSHDAVVLSALKAQFQADGFQVATIDNPMRALEESKRQSFTAILAEEELPSMKGLEFLAKVKDSQPTAVRLLLTSRLSLKELLEAVQNGLINRFVTKPWLHEELLAIFKNALACNLPCARPQEGADGESELTVAGAADETSEEDHDGRKTYSPQQAQIALDTHVKMIRAFHPNLGSGASRAMTLCQGVSQVLQLPADQEQSLIWAGGLHDVGLITLERALVRRWLRSPDGCSEEELAHIKRHPIVSEELLQDVSTFQEAGVIIRNHHENWDGSGYPERIRGEAIPWLARVLSACIFFSGRSSGSVQALKDLEAQRDRMFDPKAVEAVAQAVSLVELPKGEREVSLKELQPGMVLAGDIRSAAGMLVLAKGKELTTAWVNKLLAISSSTPLDPNILIYY